MTKFTRSDETNTLNTLISTLHRQFHRLRRRGCQHRGQQPPAAIVPRSARASVAASSVTCAPRSAAGRQSRGRRLVLGKATSASRPEGGRHRPRRAGDHQSGERGEDYLKEKFETALSAGSLWRKSRAVVERAYQSVRSGNDQVSALKHGLEA